MDLLHSGPPESGPFEDILLKIARNAIGAELGYPEKILPDHPHLHCLGATFVTLSLNGELRGCIGSLLPVRPLGEDIRENARNAAFRDPRFFPLAANEWKFLKIGISILSPPEELFFNNLEDLAEQISEKREGLILRWEHRSATYLPEVWEMISDPEMFLKELLKKGHIPPDAKPPGLRAFGYSSTVIKES